jgi:hypothetical protein
MNGEPVGFVEEVRSYFQVDVVLGDEAVYAAAHAELDTLLPGSGSLTERYAYLQGLEPMIVTVTADGKTLYRLRSATGSPALARDICGRLRVAGEACSVVD